MSNSRLQKSTSRSNKSFLNKPIEYRQIILSRGDHRLSPDSTNKHMPTQSRLEGVLQLQKQQSILPLTTSHSQTEKFRMRSRLSSQHTGLIRKRNSSVALKQPNSLAYRKDTSMISNRIGGQHSTMRVKTMENQEETPVKKILKSKREESLSNQILLLEDKLNKLVEQKLKLTVQQTKTNRTQKILLQAKRKSLNFELQQVIAQIRALHETREDGESMILLNQKISFIQKLMAENSTEADIMKKYYYALSSNKKKFKHTGSNLIELASKQFQTVSKRNKTISSQIKTTPKPLFEQTTNRQSYRSPKATDYESYRYKHKNIAPNLQPLPRSSYKREFLYVKGEPDKKIINRDHSPYYPKLNYIPGSIYLQDYKSIKTEVTDHKQLDAYRNKIKTLKVSYMPKHRKDTLEHTRKDYYNQQGSPPSRIKQIKHRESRISEQESVVNRNQLKSQTRRQFKGESSFEKSRIKDKQLSQYHYQLKKLFKV